MADAESPTGKVARNALFLYLRMLVLLFVGLFTSRVVLQALGVEEYGIYNVVGGVVGLFAFLRNTMTNATIRFLAYEQGRRDKRKLEETFAASLTIHTILAVAVVLLVESVGWWLLNSKLVIPSERMGTAVAVFHLSALSCLIGIIVTPFHALITAHEKMKVFAGISSIEALCKLAIAALLLVASCDRLLLYASLLFAVGMLVHLITVGYCLREFEECKCHWMLPRQTALPMLKYSGWNLLPGMSDVARTQGVSILLNTFFGPVVNAASAVASQVQVALLGFTENIITAAKPQIIKLYAAGERDLFQLLISRISRYSYFLMLFFSVPVLVETDQIMGLWLVEVPEYAVSFCRLIIVNSWISILFRTLGIAITATGRVSHFSLINSLLYILVLPLSWVLLNRGCSATVPFIWNIVLLFIGQGVFALLNMSYLLKWFNIWSFVRQVVLKCVMITLLVLLLPLWIHGQMPPTFMRVVVVVLVSLLSSSAIIYLVGFAQNERAYLLNAIQKYTLWPR